MADMKEKILKGIAGIPAESLLKYMHQQIVSYSELLEHGLDQYPEKLSYLKGHLAEQEKSHWEQACGENTVEAYVDFLALYSDGEHVSEARRCIMNLDDVYWQYIQKDITKENLEKYLKYLPQGNHIRECNELLTDLPWLEAKKRNTIAEYEEYSRNYPERHVAEIQQAIFNIKDDLAWETAEMNHTTKGYQDYLREFPNGVHAAEAKDRIDNRSLKDTILEQLRKEDNAYSAWQIQTYVKNNTLSWDDLKLVFSEEQIAGIKNWTQAAILPHANPPAKLQRDSTEVFFWGTKGTGKTCAMGAILSAAKRDGILVAQQCQHRVYLDQLANLFAKSAHGSICNLPDSNPIDSISEMLVHLIDDKQRPHKITFIDLAGEVVTGIYKLRNGIPLIDSEKQTIERVMSYLQDDYNNKIHFFVVDYGAAKNYVQELEQDGVQVYQEDILSDIATFLSQKKNGGGLFKSTVGVYVLVTKSDLIPCTPAERPRVAHDYVNTELAAFWKQIKIISAAANIKEVKTISFSIGDVFAKSLCKSEKEDSEKIIEVLKFKTKPEHTGLLSFLFK